MERVPLSFLKVGRQHAVRHRAGDGGWAMGRVDVIVWRVYGRRKRNVSACYLTIVCENLYLSHTIPLHASETF